MRTRSVLIPLFALLSIVSIPVHATVILMDEHVDMQSSLTVLGNTYQSSIKGSLQHQTPPLQTKEYIGILYEFDENEIVRFAGLTQDPTAVNTGAYFGSSTVLEWSLGNYIYCMTSMRGQFRLPDSPEADEAYHDSVMDDFVEVTVRFRVDGIGDVLRTRGYTTHGLPLVEHLLYDHTTGVGMNLDGSRVLEDGHVYTMTSRGRNYLIDDDFDLVGGFGFSSSSVVMAEPSRDLLWLAGLSSLLLIRASTWVRKRS
jgi:hypothetical protein